MHDYKCTCYLVKYQYIPTFDVMLIVFISVNVILSLISWWRCYANNYLHWGAYATWILLSIQGKIQYSFRNESYYFKCLPKYPESNPDWDYGLFEQCIHQILFLTFFLTYILFIYPNWTTSRQKCAPKTCQMWPVFRTIFWHFSRV